MAKIFETFETSFSILCVLVAFSLVCWCISEYRLDGDLSLVSLKKFGEDENLIMPEMSLCFYDPFLIDKIESLDLGFDFSYLHYKYFLLGGLWDQRMLEMDVEHFTKRIEDYILSYHVTWKNYTESFYNSTSPLPAFIKKPTQNYVGVGPGGAIIKCYAIQIPMNARSFSLQLKSDIFPGGIRPVSNGLALSFHYPNQLLRSLDNIVASWPTQIQSQNQLLQMVIKMNAFEVTILRNSRNHQCSENWKGYDIDVARKYFKEIGCRPVYAIWNLSYPICNSSEQMAMAHGLAISENIEPCQSASEILFEHVDLYHPVSDIVRADSFLVTVDMKFSKFKVIEQKKAYELQTLMGNGGGYIGLLLGRY